MRSYLGVDVSDGGDTFRRETMAGAHNAVIRLLVLALKTCIALEKNVPGTGKMLARIMIVTAALWRTRGGR
jgi:hypothetical protein